MSESVSGLPGPLLRVSAPQQALIALLTLFHPAAAPPPGIDASAIVAREARVDPTASIGAMAGEEALRTICRRQVFTTIQRVSTDTPMNMILVAGA